MGVIRESARHFRKYMPFLALFAVVGWIPVICHLLVPQLVQLIIDRVITPAITGTSNDNNSVFNFILRGIEPTDYYGLLGAIVSALVVVLLIRFVIHYVRWNCAHYTAVLAEKDLRALTFKKMLGQNGAVLGRYTQGELLSIINSDAVMLKDMFVFQLPFLSDQVLTIGISVFFLFRISPYLAIAPFVLGIFLSVSTAMYIRRLNTVYNEIRNSGVNLNSGIQESIGGVKIIKSFSREEHEKQRFSGRNERYREAFFGHANVWSKYQAIFTLLGLFINTISLVIGVYLGVNGRLSVGEFATFIVYVTTINLPMIHISNIMGSLQQCVVCGNRLFGFLHIENPMQEVENAVAIEGKPNFEFKEIGVNFEGKQVLNNISLSLPYGKSLGIMGKTGSGKSALLKTISGHFEIAQGELLVNGTDIRQVKVKDLRGQFSYVLQDVFLFSNTVDANIAFFNPDADKQDVVVAAQRAEADAFIRGLSDGYDTVVGERGLGLSGGQKQRVSIARALLKNAPVIMLDDCTSALDLETERKIMNNIREYYPDRTLIVVSHRAASVAFCDEIVYLDNGTIIERGTHSELMELDGHYKDIFNKQALALLGI